MIPPTPEQPVVGDRGGGDCEEEKEQLLQPTSPAASSPFLFPSTAISTSPYSHTATIHRSTYLSHQRKVCTRYTEDARLSSKHHSLLLFIWDGFSALEIFAILLCNWVSILGLGLTVGGTLLAYYYVPVDRDEGWESKLPDILLTFAVITPLSQSLSMGWARRETALKALATYRSAVNNLYVAHSAWDWGECNKGKGRRGCIESNDDLTTVYGGDSTNTPRHIDWMNHSDTTLCHLIHLSDSLCEYLTLPSATRVRHRATAKGRREANKILSTGREIFTFNVSGRMCMISQLCESLKYRGLPGNEASRIRQWENTITTAMEELRNVKEYRTLGALRVYERVFCLFLPPFYATNYANVAMNTNLGLGLATGIITSIALTGLFECVRTLEDPFLYNQYYDGIDVREELKVLTHQELIMSRKMWFPMAEEFVLMKDCCYIDNIDDDPTKRRGSETFTKEDRASRHFSQSLFEKVTPRPTDTIIHLSSTVEESKHIPKIMR
jgi:hypothetical protein